MGGCDSDDKDTTAIHMYNTTTNIWEVISQCLVAVLPHNELMGVGEYTLNGETDSVEIASIIWYVSFTSETNTVEIVSYGTHTM